MLFIIRIIIFILGISVGSFLNCFIYRIEKEESMKGRSYCPKCKHQLSYKDLFPILSFLFLKGRCRYCKEKISFQYIFIELITGFVFLGIFNYLFSEYSNIFTFDFIYNFLFLITISFFLILIFVYDLKHYLIPDFATYTIIIISFINLLIKGDVTNGIFSATISFVFFLSIYLITKGKGMGFGDVKLSIFIGLFLGYPNFLVALFTSFLIGAIIGIGLILGKKKSIKSEVPFGPFLIVGTIIALFLGNDIIHYYLKISGF